MAEEMTGKNFIEQIIEKDIAEGKVPKIVTRFPPEPNGYLHIGHAKSILLNYGLAQQYGGQFNLRFDDTNPTKEKTEFVESILADVKWLGADFGDRVFFASNYFDQMYEAAIKLIKKGKAYVCDLTADEIREIIGAESLGYMKLEDLQSMVGELPICRACLDGKYPMDITGHTEDKKQ